MRRGAYNALTMSEPWYTDGLRFRCTRCGHCCTGAPGYVWVEDEELRAIAEFRGEPVEEVTGLYTRPAWRGRTLREHFGLAPVGAEERIAVPA